MRRLLAAVLASLVLVGCGGSGSFAPLVGQPNRSISSRDRDREQLVALLAESEKKPIFVHPMSMSRLSNDFGVKIPADLAERRFPSLSLKDPSRGGTRDHVYRFLSLKIPNRSSKESSRSVSSLRAVDFISQVCTITVYGWDNGDGTWSYDHSTQSCYTVDTGAGPAPTDSNPIDCASDPSLCAAAKNQRNFNRAQELACLYSGGKFVSVAKSQSSDAGVVYCWTQFSGALIAMTPGGCPYILTIRTDDGIQFEKIGGDPSVIHHGDLNSLGARLGGDCIPRFSSNGYF